ncbi:MAG: hypothetical protein ACK4K7_13765 [Allosphingosinicella sp.]|uniref:hypothetical protein n=1 Tax=Allosphingosinicella sp. TaxID=2823234 RepID=UPI00394B1245
MTEPPFTSADFHTVIQKHIANAVASAMADAKLGWDEIEPFLEAGRRISRADYARGPKVQLHATAERDGLPVDADEAYVGVTIADQHDGTAWLSETYWLSDVVLARQDADHVRASVRALERTIEKLNAWLDARQGDAV